MYEVYKNAFSSISMNETKQYSNNLFNYVILEGYGSFGLTVNP